MNSITEKHTDKKFSIGMHHEHAAQNERQSKKQYVVHYTDSSGNDLGPEILEAHILALLGNALS